jgi:ParB family transcriptional regulator, chromosome partitioning protein
MSSSIDKDKKLEGQASNKPLAGRLPSPPRREGNQVVRSLLSQRLEKLEVEKNQEAIIVPLSKLTPNPEQPRQVYKEELEQELADSIREYGILEPLLVRQLEGGKYQIIAGERRYRAASRLGLEHVPVILKNYDDEQTRVIALVDNLQRSDLDALDEARYFRYLIDTFNVSERDIAAYIHKSKSYVHSRLELLSSNQVPNQENVSQETISTTPATSSEINHNRSDLNQKLQNSQSKRLNPSKPLNRFRDFLTEVQPRIDELKREERSQVAEQLRDLRRQMETLEYELLNSTEN